MGGARETPESAIDTARRRSGRGPARAGGGRVVPPRVRPGCWRCSAAAGNAAVSALLAGRMRSSGAAAVCDIDAALREVRRDEPAVETVEKGLKAAKAAGVPVDLDGAAQKPPASALAVVRTGFGPEAVPAKKPVPPPKPVPKVSPLGKAAAKPGGDRRGHRGRRTGARRCPGDRSDGGRGRCRPGVRRGAAHLATNCWPRRCPRPVSSRPPTRRSPRSPAR